MIPGASRGPSPAYALHVLVDRGVVTDVTVGGVSLMHLVTQVTVVATPRGTATNVQLKQEFAHTGASTEALP